MDECIYLNKIYKGNAIICELKGKTIAKEDCEKCNIKKKAESWKK